MIEDGQKLQLFHPGSKHHSYLFISEDKLGEICNEHKRSLELNARRGAIIRLGQDLLVVRWIRLNRVRAVDQTLLVGG